MHAFALIPFFIAILVCVNACRDRLLQWKRSHLGLRPRRPPCLTVCLSVWLAGWLAGWLCLFLSVMIGMFAVSAGDDEDDGEWEEVDLDENGTHIYP